MIEVIYKDEKKKPVGNEAYFDIPKNIRQIGEVDEHYKIYIEDYAYHYLDRMAEQVSGGKIALLLGHSNWSQGVTYLFIKSAFQLEDMEADANHIPFYEDFWMKVSKISSEKFPGQEIVGWFFTMPECTMNVTEAMYRAHLSYFAGNDKVLFLKEPLDKEETFFRYDNGKMCRQRGYYLYYERNEAMQEFMIEKNENRPMEEMGEVRDQAVREFREIISGKKKETKKEKSNGSLFMYASAAAVVLLALALGVNYLNGYEKMKTTTQTAREMAAEVMAPLPVETRTPLTNTPVVSVIPTAEPDADGKEKTVSDGKSEQNEDAMAEDKTGQNKEAKKTTERKKDSGEAAEETTENQEKNVQTPEENKTEAAAAESRSYTILPGDTLTSISKAYYGTVDMIDEICHLNNLTKNSILYPGEKIMLP